MNISATYFFIVLAVIAGMMMPTQASINNQLAGTVGSPVVAAFISFVVGTLALFAYILLTGTSLPGLLSLRNISLVSWTGGLLGAFFVASSVILVPKLGVALTFSLIIAGQMLVTLVLDHYGFFGVPVKEVNIQRVIGAALIVAGVILIRRF
jgi:bacterial/archaeal transporter family-2 protein